ncbi:MAG: class B sortase [Clostridia bacterium]|nr:class B sortase [Clostridia bacterium]
MADNNKNNDNIFSSISNEEDITEIDFGSFLADKDNTSVLYEGFHEDIEKTEKSLADELQNLYDDIMATGPVTIVPRTMEEIAAKENPEEEKPSTPLEEMWLSPEEYIEVPPVEASSKVDTSPSVSMESAKDDIFELIENLKSDTDSETGFDELLADIESDKQISPLDDMKDIDKLTEEFVARKETPKAESPAKKGYLSDDPEFMDELSSLLGDDVPGEEPVKAEQVPPEGQKPVKKVPFVINIPDEEENAPVSVPVETLIPTENRQKTVGIEPVEVIEDDGKITRKEKKQAKKETKELEGKNSGAGEAARRVVLVISMIVILVCSGILVNTYIIEPYQFKKHQQEVSDAISDDSGTFDNASEAVVSPESDYPEGMLLKYTKLYDINPDLRGWISVPAYEINLPVAQGTDNDYYLHRNIYKKRTNYGVPFFDSRIRDFKNLPRNTVIYGHNMRHDDLIFGMLEDYRDIDGFKKAPVIECNTIYGDHTWFVYAAFISNAKEAQDNGYVFPYNFIDLKESKFIEYINELDKRKFYTTGIDILPTDKILTLSTCCYDFDDARLVVVARLRRDGESSTFDTSKAVKNENPKYPQAWYDANKKTNPYSDDARWNPNSTVD